MRTKPPAPHFVPRRTAIHIRVWRKWVGPKGHKTQTGPIEFFRPVHHYICSEYREYIDGPPHTKQHAVKRWYTQCNADDYTNPHLHC